MFSVYQNGFRLHIRHYVNIVWRFVANSKIMYDLVEVSCPICHVLMKLCFFEDKVTDCSLKQEIDPYIQSICEDCLKKIETATIPISIDLGLGRGY